MTEIIDRPLKRPKHKKEKNSTTNPGETKTKAEKEAHTKELLFFFQSHHNEQHSKRNTPNNKVKILEIKELKYEGDDI